MRMIDTRDLIDERSELQQTVLDAYNEEFETDFSDFDEINLGEVDYTEEEIDKLDSFKDLYSDELEQIEQINDLEEEINNGEFDFDTTLIDESDFEEYCEEFCNDVGYISRDTPSLIANNIDWKGIADDMKQDYSEVTFRGITYLYR